jgi:hypothetical protein
VTDPAGPGGSLGPDARALLDAARDGLAPDAAAMRRMRGKIELAAGGAAGTAIGIKLALLAVVVAVGVGAGVVATRWPAVAIAPRVELASPPEGVVQVAVREPAVPAISDEDLITIEPTVGPTADPTADPTVDPTADPTADLTAKQMATPSARPTSDPSIEPTRKPVVIAPRRGSVAEPGRMAATERRVAEPGRMAAAERLAGVPARGAPAARNVAGPRAAGATAATLAREVELVDLAMAALRQGDPAAALRAVQQHASETAGRGQLAEDATAIEIEARCHLHDPTTHAKLEAFDARYPRSAQRSRLSSTCP